MDYENGSYSINCFLEKKKKQTCEREMQLKLVRIRHNGEQIIDEGDDFKENINEVKAALDKYVPSVYKAYMCYDKQGNMVASKGVFEDGE